MKKLILTLGMMVAFMFGFAMQADASTDHVHVVKKADFMTLDLKEEPNHTTIVGYTYSVGNGEAEVENIFDYTDNVYLEGEFAQDLTVGDIVLITFYKDDVHEVKLNDLNIENKVIGQRLATNDFELDNVEQYVQAEDGSWVSESYFKGMKKKELAQKVDKIVKDAFAKKEQPKAPVKPKQVTKAPVIKDDDSFESNNLLDPNRGKKGYVQAEDGSWMKVNK